MKLKKMLLWAGGLFLAYQVLKPKTPPANPGNGGQNEPLPQGPPVVERGGITLKRLRTV